MTIVPSFAALRAFEAVGRLRGIRRAADELGISHAAVSKQLGGLEAQIGSRLFDREGRYLTELGAVYHQRISAALDQLLRATQDVSLDSLGQLRISCAPGLALHWLTARLPQFRSDRGRPLLIDLQTFDRVVDFATERMDGDIRYTYADASHHTDPGVRMVELASPNVFPVASAEFVSGISGEVHDAADILQLPLIEERDQMEWQKWLSRQGVIGDVANRVARYGHAHLTMAAARAGQGVALTNLFLAAEDLRTGRLVRVRPAGGDWPVVTLGAYVFRASRSKWDDYRVRRFRNWLVAEFHKASRDFGLTPDHPA